MVETYDQRILAIEKHIFTGFSWLKNNVFLKPCGSPDLIAQEARWPCEPSGLQHLPSHQLANHGPVVSRW